MQTQKPLVDKLTGDQQARREAKIKTRLTVAEMTKNQHMVGLVLQNFFTRNLMGRLRWLLTGR